MRKFQNHTRIFQQIKIAFIFILSLLIVVFFSFNIFNFIAKAKVTTRNMRIAEEKVKELEETKILLQEEINSLQTEKGVETNIREKFGLAKEGEKLIVVVKEETSQEDKKSSKNIFSAIKDWFE